MTYWPLGFHSRDGFHFARLDDGSVRVALTRPVLRPDGEPTLDQAVIAQVVLPPAEWASVVASVSKYGETGVSWSAALDWHGGSPLSEPGPEGDRPER